MQTQQGFTLIELLVALLITTLLTALGAVSFERVMFSYQRSQAREQIRSDLLLAKAKATAKRTRTICTINGSGTGYQIGLDILPYSTPPAIDNNQVLFTRELPEGITLTGATRFVFDSRGYLVDANGEYATQTFSLTQDQVAYTNGTVYPTGYVQY